MRKRYRKFIEKLEGSLCLDGKRSADMCCFHFECPDGEKFAVHLQGVWRIRTMGRAKILLSTDDIYTPDLNLVRPERFKWSNPGTAVYDTEIEKFLHGKEKIFVRKVTIGPYHDLSITFSNDTILECILVNFALNEAWRFFSLTDRKGKHLVVEGNKIGF